MLDKVYDSTLLSKTAVYQIDGCSYQFLGKDPYSSIKSPKYRFKPLPGQKKHSELALNHKQLMIRCYEVTGMAVKTQTESVQSVKTLQLELF